MNETLGDIRDTAPYRLSFTFGGLLVIETMAVLHAYAESEDWNVVRQILVEKGGLGKTRKTAAFRYFREIRDRLQVARDWEREMLISGPEGDRPAVLLAIVARYYRVIGDYLGQVVRDRLEHGPDALESYLFTGFLERQADQHPQVVQLSATTVDKLRSVCMRMLREAGVAIGRREPYAIAAPRLSDGARERYCTMGTSEDLAHLLFRSREMESCR